MEQFYDLHNCISTGQLLLVSAHLPVSIFWEVYKLEYLRWVLKDYL